MGNIKIEALRAELLSRLGNHHNIDIIDDENLHAECDTQDDAFGADYPESDMEYGVDSYDEEISDDVTQGEIDLDEEE